MPEPEVASTAGYELSHRELPILCCGSVISSNLLAVLQRRQVFLLSTGVWEATSLR